MIRNWMNFTDETPASSSHQQVNAFDSWVGLHYVRRQWAFVDGTRIKYSNWLVGQPSSESETCAEIINSNGQWNDVSCTTAPRRYLCQFSEGVYL